MQKDTNKGGDNLVGTFSLQIHFFNAKRQRKQTDAIVKCL